MEVEDRITINKAYASKYEKKKRAEELSKRKRLSYLTSYVRECMNVYAVRDKYGDVGLNESECSSSDDEEEDENAEVMNS